MTRSKRKVQSRLAGTLIVCACLAGCDLWPFGPDPEVPDPTDGPSDGPSLFTFTYNHSSSSMDVTATIGLWMYKEQRFARDAIADWLQVPYQERELLEPINVLWVDPVASSEEEAKDNIVEFLDECAFDREGDVFFGLVPKHSSGYYASYGTDVWKSQHDQDDAWVEGFLGGEFPNNHGRIFPAFRALSTAGAPVYMTAGAFSREGGLGSPFLLGLNCAFNRENCHPYRSFNEARNALNCGALGWSETGAFDFGNRYPVSLGLSFSTGDHNGVLVFEHTR